jgi:hypothetical protein
MSADEMVVLHLDTGHILAAASVDGAPATVDALTGASHLVVRASTADPVSVPAAQLSATKTDADLDVLVAPMSYRVVDAVPRVSFVGPPASVPETNNVPIATGTPLQELLAVWQVGRSVEVVRSKLDVNGKLPLVAPPGATRALVALEGQPLGYIV